MPDLSNTTLLPRVRAAFDRRLLERLLANRSHDVALEKRPLSMRSGNQIKFRRFESLAAATTPLTEGVTPTGTVLDDTQLTSTIYQLGDFVTITDIAEGTDESALIAESIDIAGEQASDSVDKSIRDVINAGTYYIRATGDNTYGSNDAGGSEVRTNVDYIMDDTYLNAAIRQLEGFNVKKFKSVVKHGTGIGSLPVAESYIAIVHPHVAFTLRGMTGFIAVQEYGNYTDIMPGEIGAWKYGIRFVMTSNAKIWLAGGGSGTTYRNTGSVYDVYGTLVMGKGFAAMTDFEGGVRVEYQPRGSAGTADPLKQRSTVGWIVDMVPTILNDYCGVRIETCAAL
jgi:N4-gp56 family major capsid protein